MDGTNKLVQVKDKQIGGEKALICTPLVGSNIEELREEIEKITPKQPDMIEWRADYFNDLALTEKVMEALELIYVSIDGAPLLITIRSEKEGGEPISLHEQEKILLIESLCATGKVDLIDYELVNDDSDFQRLRDFSKKHNVKMIGSYHNFELTPGPSTFLEKSQEAERRGADIAKISVMPVEMEDVLLLLQATQTADKFVSIPLVTISMGRFGVITRMFGRMFGSTITFGIGEQSSAPGQMPIDDLRTVMEIMKKSM